MSESERVAPQPKQYPPPNELWQIPGIVAAIGMFIAAWYFARNPMERPSSNKSDFDALVMAYESGDTMLSASSAKRYLALWPGSVKEKRALAHFIMADSRWDLTKSNPATTRTDLTDCLQLFERALLVGVEPQYKERALEAKGDIHVRLGQVADSLNTYTELTNAFPGNKDATLRLALAYAEAKPPLSDRAGEYVDRYLSFEGLTPHEIRDGYLVKARLALEAGEYSAAVASARRVLDANGEGESGAHAALMLSQALLAEGDFAGALAVLDAVNTALAGRFEAALYLARATALWKSGQIDEARKALDEVVFTFPGTPESLSARYQMAMVFFGSGETDAARDALVSLLDDMAAQQSIGTEYFGMTDVTDLWFAVGRKILEAEDYDAVRLLHSAAAALMTEGHFLYFDATLYLQEAEQQESLLPGLLSDQAETLKAEIKESYLEAGRLFDRVLDTSDGDLYIEALFNAGHALYRAGECAAAVRHFARFREQALDDERLPKALYEEADCLAAMGSFGVAIGHCRLNAETYPTNIYAYRAILLQGDLYRKMGGESLDHAADIYRGILTDHRFQAESVEWRRAIYSLGETLYELGQYREAVLKLDEALVRFPDDSAALEARFTLALACRETALDEPQYRQEFLAKSAGIFSQIALGSDEEKARRAAFLEADCYYDMEDYQRALTLYDRAVEANVDTEEAARALFWIANCYHRLGADKQAEATYQRALLNLERRGGTLTPGTEFYESLASWRGNQEGNS